MFSDNNIDMFSSKSTEPSTTIIGTDETPASTVSVPDADKYLDQAARLRKEAEAMEVALREEARAKGLPEEMINKLIPITSNKPKKVNKEEGNVEEMEKPKPKQLAVDIRSKLGYLNTGDAVRVTTELDRIKAKGFLQHWNTYELKNPNFDVSNGQLTIKTGIEPVQLKLDDVGYNYQLVLGVAVAVGTILALGSTQIGGEIGFISGYLSALIPIAIVGIGSIAPALIGEVINQVKFIIDEDARKRFIYLNAGKFLVGYILGLPMARFGGSGPSNVVEFFQIRPSGPQMSVKEKQMFARNEFKQIDIAKSSAVCLAGSVAECIYFGEANGTNAGDVNQLYELMTTVQPALSPDSVQNHIRWSAITAYDIINNNQVLFNKLVEAFEAKLPLEECIACLEGREEPMEKINTFKDKNK